MNELDKESIFTVVSSSFPTYLNSDVALLVKKIGALTWSIGPGYTVKVGTESIVIPGRIYQKVDERILSKLPHALGTMYSCILTRHNDGYLRQRQLERILDVSELWVAPFVIQLASEYVAEILGSIDASIGSLDTVLYAKFLRENPAFYKKARDRMISYWDCYYRRLYKYKNDYVGFRLFAYFDKLINSSQ